MTEQEEQELRATLAGLKEEHRDLDDAIYALEALPMPDHLQIKRLKKKKLQLPAHMPFTMSALNLNKKGMTKCSECGQFYSGKKLISS